MATTILTLLALTVGSGSAALTTRDPSCDTIERGYECDPEVAHNWGQYSPYFAVPSEISADVPAQCTVTFAQLLSRHGARYPTADKGKDYRKTIQRIQKRVTSYPGDYAFLESFKYDLGTDDLTTFGQQELVNSGIKFFDRYRDLALRYPPFVRASSMPRVVQSARNWTQGFLQEKAAHSLHEYAHQHPITPTTDPYPILIINEPPHSNDTLCHGICTNFDQGPNANIANDAKAQWAAIFVPAIQDRLNTDLAGADLESSDIIHLMDLCPFETVASATGALSPFCQLFHASEWPQYDYHGSLDKFYGFGAGNPLGATQGVGFTNELVARMTDAAVVDHTSTNRTLDADPATFPLGARLYADFSHDDDLTSIFFAMGLYDATAQLSNTTMQTIVQTDGYSAAYTVPFSARAYFEKLDCEDRDEETVRVIVNDRVVPLQNCGADDLGRCGLQAWVDSLSFATGGGLWDQCFN